jgi:hypothetical protein
MLDDLVCPACQVVLPEGRSICVKCGRKVEPEKTHLGFIDLPRTIYSYLVDRLGPVGAGVVAGVVFVILLVVTIGLILRRSIPAQ